MYLTGPVIAGVLMPVSFIYKMLTLIVVIVISVLINQFVENRLLVIVRRSFVRLVKPK